MNRTSSPKDKVRHDNPFCTWMLAVAFGLVTTQAHAISENPSGTGHPWFNSLSPATIPDSTGVTPGETAKCLALYRNVQQAFDDNFNFDSEVMIKTLLQLEQLTIRDSKLDTLLSDIYGKMAICYEDLGEDELAFKFLDKAKRARKKKIADRSLFNIYLTLGSLFMKTYVYDSSEYYFTYIENHLSDFNSLRKNEMYRLWNELGVLHYYFGDYRLSYAYYERAFRDASSVFQQGSPEVVNVRNNRVAILLKLGRIREAIQQYKALVAHNNLLQNLYHNLGKAYQQLNEPDSALIYLNKAESIATDDALRVKIFNNLGITYIALSDFSKAEDYLNRSISLNRKYYKAKNAALAYSFMHLGRIKEKQKNTLAALQHYQEALHILHFDFTDQNIYVNPEDPGNVVSKPYFFECLQDKAAALRKYYEQTHDIQALQSSLSAYTIAVRVMDIIRKSYSSEETKLLFSEKTSAVYADAVAVAFRLYEQTHEPKFQETAFEFSEKSKMAVLTESLRDVKFRQLSGIPEALLREEHLQKQRINKLLAKLADAKDTLQSTAIKNDLAAGEIILAKLQDQLEQNTKYKTARNEHRQTKIKDIQKYMAGNEGLIEYFFSGQEVFVFILTSDRFITYHKILPPQFFDAAEKFRTSLYEAKEGSSYQESEAPHVVYQFLIEPLIQGLKEKARWTIVPDGPLHNLPVEAMVSDLNGPRFVIEDHSIRYQYAAALMSPAGQEQHSNNILAFAPFERLTGHTEAFDLLRSSGKEIEDLPGKHYLNEQATKNNFIREARSFAIIHLATHAETSTDDPSRSFIRFYPDSQSTARMYMPDIYNLELERTKLVVISACEAGTGKLMMGEGLMSMTRAFAIAGCPGMITSLWKVDDESSAEIMVSMYRYLRKGVSRDEALRLAKLEYLQSDRSERLRSPAYWANFICIGDTAPLYETDQTVYALIASFVFIIAAGFAIYRLFKKRSRLFNVRTIEKMLP